MNKPYRTSIELPPYGFISEQYEVLLSSAPMSDWPKNADWEEFKESYIDSISQFVWPRYHKDTNNWSGDATSFCTELTEHEISVMIEEFQSLSEAPSKLETYPDYVQTSNTYRFNHFYHFQAEDGVNFLEKEGHKNKPIQEEIEAARLKGSNFVSYLPNLDIDKFHDQFYVDRIRKLKGLFDFKDTFQRPRPLQTALIFGQENFSTHIGLRGKHTGMTPSLISGHCLQGILQTCKVLEIWIRTGSNTKENTDALKQYAVDFGDRRVFAGVHYPTDNVASWVLALKIIPYIYEFPDEILEFAKSAIKDKSNVYSVLQKHYVGKPPMELLESYLQPKLN